MTETKPHEALARERAHYEEHRRYLLSFLDRDETPAQRWLIRQTLRTWDRQWAYLDHSLIAGKTVLEAGCGNPRMLFYCRDLGAREAIGVDLSPAFTSRGLRGTRCYVYDRQMEVRPDSIRLLHGDVNGPVTAGLQVDTVLCFQSLHHIDLPAFVATCARLLPMGGHVAISDPMGDHPLRGMADRVARWWGLLSPDEQALTPGAVTTAFARGGFALRAFHALNPVSELYFLATAMLDGWSPRLAFWSRLPLVLWRPIEDLLEHTLVRTFPRLGWRYLLVFEKVSDQAST